MRQIRREEREFMDELSPHQMCARVRVRACAYMYAYIFIYNLYPCFKLKEHGRDWEHTFKLPNASSHFVGLSPTPQKKKKKNLNLKKAEIWCQHWFRMFLSDGFECACTLSFQRAGHLCPSICWIKASWRTVCLSETWVKVHTLRNALVFTFNCYPRFKKIDTGTNIFECIFCSLNWEHGLPPESSWPVRISNGVK